MLISYREMPDYQKILYIHLLSMIRMIHQNIEVGQTKVSLTMLLKISSALEKDLDYFLLDTPYAKRDSIINSEIADKLKKCTTATLVTVNKILDSLLELQEEQIR